ncbi:MAG TPA: hypothetical protein DD670_03930, partial [Planctomycetaceae bacterium]|nr:hypothetical protein [Planctomycetaceae bacterium]
MTRDAMLQLAGDTSSYAREAAYEALGKVKLKPGESEILEGYLTRKTSDLRQGVLGLLLRQADAQAMASAERLLESKNVLQRLAGLELLRQLAQADRGRQACQHRAGVYQNDRKRLSEEEQTQVDAIVGATAEQVTLDNALGLMDPAERTPLVAPKARKVQFVTKAAVECLQSLDELVHKHRETPVRYNRWGEEVEELLGNIEYGLPWPDWNQPPETSTNGLPLLDLWRQWLASRPKSQRDKDGLELVRTQAWFDLTETEWDWERFLAWGKSSPERKKVISTLTCGFKRVKLKYKNIVEHVVAWLTYLNQPAGMIDFLLDATEASFALVPKKDMQKLSDLPEQRGYYFDQENPDWRNTEPFELWPKHLQLGCRRNRKSLASRQAARWWSLARWHDEPFVGAARQRPDFSVLTTAYDHGASTTADLLDHLLGPDRRTRWDTQNFDSLEELTKSKLDKDSEAFLATHPEIGRLVEQCRSRIVEIELARGETPTAATAPAWHVGSLWGTDLLVRLLTALGKQGFKVPLGWQKTGKESKVCTLTQLASVTHPKPDETPEAFCRLIREAVADGRVDERLILQLAFVGPQWARHVESYLRWDDLTEALYWFLAHMRYTSDAAEQAAAGAGLEQDSDATMDSQDNEAEKPSPWQRLIAERTPLAECDRNAGAVDVGWFRRIYAQVTP